MTESSDDDLMRRSGLGDRAAFGDLVARHLRRAEALAARIAGNPSDAEEIVQEAFLRTWLKAPDWRAQGAPRGAASFTTWFTRVLVNLAIDRTRRVRPDGLDAAFELADSAPGTFERSAAAEAGRRIAGAIAALPARQRAALALCHYDGLSNIEAAAALGLSVGALESLLARARKALRGKLADLNEANGTGR